MGLVCIAAISNRPVFIPKVDAPDNICKLLAEEYPLEFARWLLTSETTEAKILKTELSLEPIRADSVTFLQTQERILHIEFQTRTISKPTLPFRMLDYQRNGSKASLRDATRTSF